MKQINDPVLEAQEIVRDLDVLSSIDTEAALLRVQGKIRRRRLARTALIASAAAVAAVCAIVFLPSGLDSEPSFALQSSEEVLEAVLPDESSVVLEPHTKIEYRHRLSGTREVELSGKARFEVSHDRRNPFVVNTASGLSVKVHGTVFDIDAYPSSPTVRAVLHSGSVSVEGAGMNVALVLIPGQRLTYDKTSRKVTIDNLPNDSGTMTFNHASLEEILDSFAEHFGVTVVMKNASGRSDLYHASFETDDTIEEAMASLSELVDMSYTFSGNPEGRVLNVTF